MMYYDYKGEIILAERRMFAKTIIDSDAFLDMPLSAQSLYFHLSMRADDDGFNNNPKKIQRMIGASDDDLKLLAVKNFIIPFESGVVVIKHWRIHNYIRGDRKKETVYREEMSLLDSKGNGAYTLIQSIPLIEDDESKDEKGTLRQRAYKESSLPYSFDYKIRNAFVGNICPVCGCTMSYSNKLVRPTIQHNIPISKGGLHELGNISVICSSCNSSIRDKETDELNAVEVAEKWDEISMSDRCQTSDRQVTDKCQHRLGKDSIGKYSINIKESNTNVLPKKKINYQEIIDKYNSVCKSLPKVMKLSDARRKAINARLDKFSLEEIISVFEKAEQSNFLKGANNRNWKADFDWIMSDRNMAKILEGKYDNCNALKDNSATVTSSNTNTDRNTYTPKTTNRFNNFEQRQYSDDELDALERKLLSR